MGLFNGYLKEGPGVDKNAKKKKGIFLYFDIVFRKFIKLMSANALYFAVSIPYLVIAYIFLASFVMGAFGLDLAIERTVASTVIEGVTPEQLGQTLSVTMRMMITMVLFNFFGSGPAGASYAYAARCYTRGEHVWLLSDGWDKFKGNLKQSIPLFFIDIVVLVLGMNAVAFYSTLASSSTGAMLLLLSWAKYFTVVVIMVYMMMHIYIYQIMVTYECKFTELIKVSALITIAKLPMSVLMTAITGFGTVLAFSLNPMAGIFIYVLIGMILLRYSLEFYASRVLEKNIKVLARKEQKTRTNITHTEE